MEGKVAVVNGRTAIKRMKAREILVYTYKIIYIYEKRLVSVYSKTLALLISESSNVYEKK